MGNNRRGQYEAQMTAQLRSAAAIVGGCTVRALCMPLVT